MTQQQKIDKRQKEWLKKFKKWNIKLWVKRFEEKHEADRNGDYKEWTTR